MSMPRFLLSIAAGLTLAPLVSAGALACDEPTLEERLDKLVQTLEEARVKAHVPGMSIAIVKDDEIVLARGFGLADVENERPAEAETIYAVGSTTKAFTATLAGMLADEGKLSWDDPVTDYLPYFDLQVRSEDENAECTLRDLLSHRHGFSRMGILWLSDDLSREEILRTAAGAEPWSDFREDFHYCNVTYLAAGEAAGVAAGSSWDELMAERIFAPLGMASSTLTMFAAEEDPRLALGYEWVESVDELDRKRMVSLDRIGPAGSVNSNVLDMAQWVRLQLGKGEVDGVRLISTARLEETWSPQIAMGEKAAYGLGWMLREQDGRKVVEHGGNIDGFSAEVALVPDENLGYVLLMNLDAAPLREASLGIVLDALLHEWPDEASAAIEAVATEEIDFEDYVGVYVANFSKFRDEEFEILIQDDGLALDIPSQRTFALKAPDTEDKWGFALTDQIAVTFDRDDAGEIVGLVVHQESYSFEVPRKGTLIQPEVPAEELEKYVGIYVRVEGGKRVELSIEKGRLTMNNRGQLMAFHTPDTAGHAPLRARADQGATFKTDAEGNVESFVFHGNAGDKLFKRLADSSSPEVELPTLDEVLALRNTDARIAAMEAAGGTKITGKVRFAQAGVQGALTIYTLGGDRYANHMDFGKFGSVDIAAAGDAAWSYNTLRGLEVLKGDELTQALLGHPAAIEGDWTDYFDSVEVVRNDFVDERPVHVVRLTKGDLPGRAYWIDAEHGDVLRVNLIAIEGSIRIPVTIHHSEFQEQDGIRSPMRVEIENPMAGKIVMTLEQIESRLELGDEVFTLEDPDTEEATKN